MTNWLDKVLKKGRKLGARLEDVFKKKTVDAPKDYWQSCKGCAQMVDINKLKENYYCCPNCDIPQFITPRDRFKIFFDNGEYTEIKYKITTSHDPLNWEDLKRYKDKVKIAKDKFKQDSVLVCAEGLLNGKKVQVVAFNSQYLGGSFGLPEAQVFSQAVAYSIKEKLPFIVFVAGGGIRVPSGAAALVAGMPGVVIGFKELKEAKVPSINIFCDPLAGGLTCVFYMSDFQFAEHEQTRIIFSGRRTIESVIGEKLDASFGLAPHTLEKGFLDGIIYRKEHREKISNLLSIMLHDKKNIDQDNAETTVDSKRPISAA